MKILGVIPARFNSSRLPAKPLVDICGKPMIQWVWENAIKSSLLDHVIIATDDDKILSTAVDFGADARLTSPLCKSGTDRVCEIAQDVEADIYVNIQGDEPLLQPETIDTLLMMMIDKPDIQIGMLCNRINHKNACSPSIVKAVFTNIGKILYCSRSVIPYNRDETNYNYLYGMLGLYGYRAKAIYEISLLEESLLESIEKLELLRFLDAGIDIYVHEVDACPSGVDTIDDLERVRKIMKNSI